jgi:hypothetical protein
MPTSVVPTTTGFYTKTHSQIKVLDGGSVDIFTMDDVGDFKINGVKATAKMLTDIVHRNVYQGSEYAGPANITGSFSFTLHQETLTHATDARPLDSLLKIAGGAQAAFDSDNPSGSTAHQVKLKWILTSGAIVASIIFNACEMTVDIDGSGDQVVVAVSFICKNGFTAA